MKRFLSVPPQLRQVSGERLLTLGNALVGKKAVSARVREGSACLSLYQTSDLKSKIIGQFTEC